MKPVSKTQKQDEYKPYDKAKPELLAQLGEHCSYCGRPGNAQDLHVEHIYPNDPHPELEYKWSNFLVSCNTCNSYKNIHLGKRRQIDLERKYIWPHSDNTFKAFRYKPTGEIEITVAGPAALVGAVEATRDMVGLMLSPAKAARYQKLGVAYDGANKRSQMWGIAEGFRTMYLANPTPANVKTISDGANKLGYFNIWMEVFHDRVEIRQALILAFKADRNCFDANTQPRPKGRL